jgi:hypothetical protein
MELTRLAPTLVDRLLVLENNAAHATVMADIAANAAWRARQEADAAQAVLSQCKVWLALLPDEAMLELRAPMADADDPAMRLGVRPRLPVPRPDREEPACLARTTSAPASSATPPAGPAMTPMPSAAAGPASA